MQRQRFAFRGRPATPATATDAGPESPPDDAVEVGTEGQTARRAPSDGNALALDRRVSPAVGADHVETSRSLIGRIRARDVRLRQSASGVVLGQRVDVRQGGGWVLGGAKLNVEQSGSQWLIGGLVQAKQVFAVTVVAWKVEGQVRCLFDTRGAFAFGAGAALVGGLLRLLTHRRR